MKLILENNSSDTFTYVSGAVVLAPGTLDVNPKYWYALLKDFEFIKDLRLNNVTISDGISSYKTPESEVYLERINVHDIANRDSDGSQLSRTKITTTGWQYQLHGLEFQTSQLNSIESKKDDGTDFGFATIKCYDGSGNLLSTQAEADQSAVKTIIDWEPTHDYEILGGVIRQLSLPTSNIRCWVIGVPDIPAAAGGSKMFAANINLKFLDGNGVDVDGKAPKYLTYNSSLHTNKIRLIFTHPAGTKHSLFMMFKIFKA